MPPTEQDPTPPTRRRLDARGVLLTAVGLLVIGLTFFVVLPSIADYGEVWRQIQAMSTAEQLLVALTAVINLATFGLIWIAALPGLGYWRSQELTLTSNTVTASLPVGGPAGMAASYQMLRTWGFSANAVARTVVLTGVFKQLVSLGFPVLALALLALEGKRNPTIEAAALIGLGILGAMVLALVAVLHSERQARRVGRTWDRVGTRALRLVRRGPVQGSAERFVHFRRGSLGLIRKRWYWLILSEAVGVLTMFLVLLVTLRAVGVTAEQVDVTEAFAAWAFARLLASIPLTPGGVGFVEIGLTGLLVSFGADDAGAVAATLIYRALTLALPLVAGLVTSFTWRRHHPEPAPG
ncbi:MAG: YbhN family protein [Acidimicrobiales bacterium]|jgi:uncharacterized protein (TIRG00374 family)|nr:YbhN family protein [Acidimicrobiales bacterium]